MKLKKSIPTLAKYTYPSGTTFWLVNATVPKTKENPTGRYKKKHSNEDEADADYKRIYNMLHGGLNEEHYKDARDSVSRLKTSDNKDVQNASLVDIVKWAEPRYVSPYNVKPLKFYVDAFLAKKTDQGRREPTVDELEYMLGIFVKECGSVSVLDMDEPFLEKYCRTKHSIVKWKLTLKHFMGYLAGTSKMSKNPNPVLKSNPIDHWEKRRRTKAGTEHVGILNYEESYKLIETAADTNCQRMFVWCLLTGMRPFEAEAFWTDARFGWKSIYLDECEYGIIDVHPDIAKTGKGREILVCKALRQWLDYYPEGDHPSWMTQNWGDKFGATKKRAIPADKLKINDLLRHTWHSFILASGEDWATVVAQAGNSKEVQIKHYIRLVRDKSSVAKYWEMTPDKFETKDVLESELPKRAHANRARAIKANRAKNWTTMVETGKVLTFPKAA